jgi:hypothetical protein
VSDVHKLLPPFEWRGYRYPITSRNVSFTHDGVRHTVQYRDNGFTEQLGAQPLTFSYTLPMREDIAVGQYKNLFTVGYAVLFESMRDRIRGVLVDPVLPGEWLCVPASFNDDMDLQKRDGTDVRVEFTYSPDDDADDIALPLSLEGLISEAGALDAEVARQDWGQEPSPEPSIDPLDLPGSVVGQAEANVGKVAAWGEDTAYKLEKIEQAVDRSENPDFLPLKQAARRNRIAAKDIAKRAQDPSKRVVAIVNNYARGLSVLAAEHQMTVAELIQLNPNLSRSMFVPAGISVNIVRPSGSN